MRAKARSAHIASLTDAIDPPDDPFSHPRFSLCRTHRLDPTNELVAQHALKAHIPATDLKVRTADTHPQRADEGFCHRWLCISVICSEPYLFAVIC